MGADTDAELTRGPYLQLPTPSSVVVRWRTATPTQSVVYFGTIPGAPDRSISLNAPATEHEVQLENLRADTTYFYAVGNASSILAGGDENHFFVTPPAPGSIRPVRIWALGDAGTGTLSQSAVRDAYFAYAESRRTDVILALGDNAYPLGTDMDYQNNLFGMYASILRRTFYWPTIGNHDTLGLNDPPPDMPYFQAFTLPAQGEAGGIPSNTEAYYSFDFANIHFVCLDTQISDTSPIGALAQWLIRDLESTEQDWCVAYTHHPPYSKGSHDSDIEDQLIAVRANLVPILEEGGVDLVLSGHSHSYERSFLLDGHYGSSGEIDPAMKLDPGDGRESGTGIYRKPSRGLAPHEGAVYVVAGSAGLRSGGDFNHPAMFFSLSELGSVVLDVIGNRLDAKFLDVRGVIRDSFAIIKGQVRLASPRLVNGARFSFVLQGDPGREYEIETSSNLIDWSPFASITNALGTMLFDANRSSSMGGYFFRARKVE